MACGMALANKLSGSDKSTYVILGDGECNEGAVWEALMFGARYHLDNLIAILDRNNLQSYGTDAEVMNLADVGTKIREFGWQVIQIDGNDVEQIKMAFLDAKQIEDKPVMIVANTIKGKGVKEFENGVIWHYKWPEGNSYTNALEELEK